uniref:Uncharacterized protein n=1 Tax=Anopheles atroparvus TaxID=41427 RepID=A0A182IJP2_ANOAO
MWMPLLWVPNSVRRFDFFVPHPAPMFDFGRLRTVQLMLLLLLLFVLALMEMNVLELLLLQQLHHLKLAIGIDHVYLLVARVDRIAGVNVQILLEVLRVVEQGFHADFARVVPVVVLPAGTDKLVQLRDARGIAVILRQIGAAPRSAPILLHDLAIVNVPAVHQLGALLLGSYEFNDA